MTISVSRRVGRVSRWHRLGVALMFLVLLVSLLVAPRAAQADVGDYTAESLGYALQASDIAVRNGEIYGVSYGENWVFRIEDDGSFTVLPGPRM